MSNANPEKPEGEWIEWNGGECPVDRDQIIQARFRGGGEDQKHARAWWWGRDHRPRSYDIIAYRVVVQS